MGILAYGVGDIPGAGIYALVGEVAGTAGTQAWQSFAVTLVTGLLIVLFEFRKQITLPEHRQAGNRYFMCILLFPGWVQFRVPA